MNNERIALIVADDTTGANASGILLKKLGLSVFNELTKIDSSLKFDAITVGSASRAIDQQEANKRITEILSKFRDDSFLVYNKRVDSTLRGNLGSELDAFFNEFSGNRKCIIVPSFPDSGRICNSGDLYVNDVLLENTEVAKDPKMPITTSNVKELFEKNSNLKYDNLLISSLKNGNTNFRVEVAEKLMVCDALIIDAITNDDIEFIARNIVELGTDVICVDPGPFTQKMVNYTLMKKKAKQKNLYIVGSVVDTALMQLNYANQLSDFKVLYVDPTKFFEADYTDYINEQVKKITSVSEKHIIFETLNLENPVRLDLQEYANRLNITIDEVSSYINNGLAKLAEACLNRSLYEIKNVYLSGGDVSIAFLDNCNAKGLSLINEILPLCVHSVIVGGIYSNLNIITKGGTQGSTDALETIANYMEGI